MPPVPGSTSRSARWPGAKLDAPRSEGSRFQRLAIDGNDPGIGALEDDRHGPDVGGIEETQAQETGTCCDVRAERAVHRKPVAETALSDRVFQASERVRVEDAFIGKAPIIEDQRHILECHSALIPLGDEENAVEAHIPETRGVFDGAEPERSSIGRREDAIALLTRFDRQAHGGCCSSHPIPVQRQAALELVADAVFALLALARAQNQGLRSHPIGPDLRDGPIRLHQARIDRSRFDWGKSIRRGLGAHQPRQGQYRRARNHLAPRQRHGHQSFTS